MSELVTENLLRDAFRKAKSSNSSFDTTFNYGNRLRTFLKSKHWPEHSSVEDELFTVFKDKVIGNREIDHAASTQLFGIVLTEVEKDAHDLSVFQISLQAIERAFKENQFQRGYSLAVIADAYMRYYDGFRSQKKIEIAFQLSLLLSGKGPRKPADRKVEQQMLQLSQHTLKETFDAAKAIHLSLVVLPLIDLNSLVGLLGQQKNHSDLEWILTDLWNARHSQSSWPGTTVVAIGRRLVECRFTMGDRISVLELLEDICYNLRRIWGPLDKTTLEMETLRAQMYTAVGQHAKLMSVHEDVLAQLTSDELDMDQVPADEEATIAVKHINELRKAFFRNVQEQLGADKVWKGAKVEEVNKWTSSTRSFKDDGSGAWKGVEESIWEFMSDQSKIKHINALRRRSARYSGEYVNGQSVNGHSTEHATTKDIPEKYHMVRNGVQQNGTTTTAAGL